ncbi:MAG: HD-GYP domain-containing protein [Candidatus Krumholzibacteria bacterium]|nr:HD-GYP domain-containing protein [Candidatus Krumholzibacteria bacterium]
MKDTDTPAIDEKPYPTDRKDPDSESARHIERLGPALVHYLFSASKTVQVHDLNNRATHRVLEELMTILEELSKIEGRVSLRISTDFLVINDHRVTVDPQNYGPFLYLIEEMKKRDIEGVDFLPGLTVQEIGVFLKCFFQEVALDEAFSRITRDLEEAGIARVRLTQWVERERRFKDSSVKSEEIREESNQVFFRTVLIVGEVLRGIEQRRAIQFRKAERLTQQMVDIIQTDESILVGLASIKSFDEYTFTHSVNVCILSMLIADRLGLAKGDIAKLGVAALLHDIGKTYIPETILNKPGKLNQQEWELMKYHTFFGVKELARIPSLREVADALFVALQHHIHYNMNGYPQKAGGWNLRFFSKIATVADYYDAMTTPRVYKKVPFSPDEALKYILERSGEIFDPFIAKVFIQAMGLYPIGTVVELDTGEKAVVVRQNEARRFIHRPYVALLGATMGADETIDLTETTADGGRFKRSVVKTFYEDAAEIQKGQAFLTGQSGVEK